MSKLVMDSLQRHTWPGNIRELQHVLEKAVILNDSGMLRPSDLALTRKQPGRPQEIMSYNLEENEKLIIEQALIKYRGNISLCAEKLGINRSTLYTKIRKYGIQTV